MSLFISVFDIGVRVLYGKYLLCVWSGYWFYFCRYKKIMGFLFFKVEFLRVVKIFLGEDEGKVLIGDRSVLL